MFDKKRKTDAAHGKGARTTKSGALYLPWRAPIPADEVRAMQAELLKLIETLADYEGWPKDSREDVLMRAIRGPLVDLLPNLHYFRRHAAEARARYEARKAERVQVWRANDDLRNRGYQ